MRFVATILVGCVIGYFMGVGVPGLPTGSVAIVDVRAQEAAVTRVSTSLDDVFELPEVAWYEVRPNEVYLGFHRRSESAETIVREAAVHASQAYPSDVRVWAVPVDEIAQVGQKSMPFFCRATARDGAVVDFSGP